eukprot:2117622-Pyramimonas_sp.AAC.1
MSLTAGVVGGGLGNPAAEERDGGFPAAVLCATGGAGGDEGGPPPRPAPRGTRIRQGARHAAGGPLSSKTTLIRTPLLRTLPLMRTTAVTLLYSRCRKN